MVTRLEFANGSRILPLPENPDAIVGYSNVKLLVIDEASRVADELYKVVRPMLATSNGSIVGLSTPYGQRGWFFDAWQSSEPWVRQRQTAEECPRISREFLASEAKALGDRWFNQEYLCSFESGIDNVFDLDVVRASITYDVKPFVFQEP
jgi:hypothetical protein